MFKKGDKLILTRAYYDQYVKDVVLTFSNFYKEDVYGQRFIQFLELMDKNKNHNCEINGVKLFEKKKIPKTELEFLDAFQRNFKE